MDTVMGKSIVLMVLLAVPFHAVTVSTLCPTNKIAPHRRAGSWQRSNVKTVGAYYDLLTPNSPQIPYQDDLQEQPQEDEADDCGDIEDYDENDFSSIQPSGNYNDGNGNRFFFGEDHHRPTQHYPGNRPTRPPHTNRPPRPQQPSYPQGPQQPGYPPYRPQQPDYLPQESHQPSYPPNRPQKPGYPQQPNYPPNRPQQPSHPPYRPQKPSRPPHRPQHQNYPPQWPQGANRPPQRPPYWSGGVFGNNQYENPQYHNPSDNYKPVHENTDHSSGPQNDYRPGVVGGPLGQVVGVFQPRPTTSSDYYNTYPHTTPAPFHSTRRPRNRNDNSVIGSFIDLLL